MAEILITGLEMLPEGYAYEVKIRGNGEVVDARTGMLMGKAYEIPSHGELCDKNELYDKAYGSYQWDQVLNKVREAPVIIKSSEELSK